MASPTVFLTVVLNIECFAASLFLHGTIRPLRWYWHFLDVDCALPCQQSLSRLCLRESTTCPVQSSDVLVCLYR